MYKLVFSRKDRQKPVQAWTIEDAFLNGLFGEPGEAPKADSVLVLNEQGKHVGFLRKEDTQALLAMDIAMARKLNGHPIPLKKVGEARGGKWGIFALPPLKDLFPKDDLGELKKAVEAFQAARFDAATETVTVDGETVSWESQIDTLCSLRPWKRPFFFMATIEGVKEKMARGAKDAKDAMAFLEALADVNGVTIQDLMENPVGIGFFGRGITHPTFTNEELGELLGPDGD